MKKFFVTMTMSVCSVALLLSASNIVWAGGSPEDCQSKNCAVCPNGPRDGEMNRRGPAQCDRQKRFKASKSVAKQLRLTPEQREKATPCLQKFDDAMQKIHDGKRGNFEKVLTAEQREQFEKEKGNCHPRNIKLSDQQKAALKECRKADEEAVKQAFQTLKTELRPILNDEQKSQLDSMKAKDCFRGPQEKKRKGQKHHGKERRGGDCREMGPGGPHMGGGLPQFIIDELDLSKEQEAKVQNICRKYDEARRQRFEKMRQTDKNDFEQMMQEVSSVLNDQQKAKLAEIKERRPHDGPQGHGRERGTRQ
ncbi:MAG: hypothetical protein ACI38Q_02665 [Candidatus Bruticola sp.]